MQSILLMITSCLLMLNSVALLWHQRINEYDSIALFLVGMLLGVASLVQWSKQ